MEVVAAGAARGRPLQREPRSRRARPARQAARRLEPAARDRSPGYRLGTHLDGVTNRGEATEYPAARGRRAPAAPLLHGREQRLGALGARRRRGAAAPVDEDAEPRLARRLLGGPAVLGTGSRSAGGPAPRRRQGGRPRRAHPRAARVGDGRDGARRDEPGRGAGGERAVGRGREPRAAASNRSSPSPTASRCPRSTISARARAAPPEPARAPRRLRLSVVQPAHRPAAAAALPRDAGRPGRRHPPELQPARRRARADGTVAVAQEHMNFNAHRRGLARDLAAATARSTRSRC